MIMRINNHQLRNQIKYTIMIVGLSEYIYRKLEEDGNN